MAFGDFHNVSGAGWSVYWRIPKFNSSGLEVWWADFQGRRVMWRGSAPFAIVPYHHPDTNGEPPGPDFSYKDGIDVHCGGAPFRALKHGAPTAALSGKITHSTPRTMSKPSSSTWSRPMISRLLT